MMAIMFRLYFEAKYLLKLGVEGQSNVCTDFSFPFLSH